MGEKPWAPSPCAAEGRGEGATPGIFLCFCSLFKFKKTVLSLFQQSLHTISSTYTIYSSNRKHALRKTPYLPNHICYAAAVYFRRELTFTAIFLFLPTDYFDECPINASETAATNNTPTKNVRVLAPPMLFNVELLCQCQLLIFRPIPASNEPLSTSDATYFKG